MPTVKDLKDIIRKHKGANCPTFSGKKKAELEKIVSSLGLKSPAPTKSQAPKGKTVIIKRKKKSPASLDKDYLDFLKMVKYRPVVAEFKKYKYDLEIDLTPLKSKIDKGIVTKKEIDDVTEKQYEQVEKLMKNTGSPKSLKDAIKEAKKIKKAL